MPTGREDGAQVMPKEEKLAFFGVLLIYVIIKLRKTTSQFYVETVFGTRVAFTPTIEDGRPKTKTTKQLDWYEYYNSTPSPVNLFRIFFY